MIVGLTCVAVVVALKTEDNIHAWVVASKTSTLSKSVPAEEPPTYWTLLQLALALNHCPSGSTVPPTLRCPVPWPPSITRYTVRLSPLGLDMVRSGEIGTE